MRRTVPGDCGSWVVNAETGDIYGHIVAGDPISGLAYIIPAYKVFDDIEFRFGVRPVLPEWSPLSPVQPPVRPLETIPIPGRQHEKMSTFRSDFFRRQQFPSRSPKYRVTDPRAAHDQETRSESEPSPGNPEAGDSWESRSVATSDIESAFSDTRTFTTSDTATEITSYSKHSARSSLLSTLHTEERINYRAPIWHRRPNVATYQNSSRISHDRQSLIDREITIIGGQPVRLKQGAEARSEVAERRSRERLVKETRLRDQVEEEEGKERLEEDTTRRD